MNAKLLFEALGEIDGAYVEQAAQYRGIAARRGLMKWGALAACLCLLAAVLIPALAARPEPQSGGAAGSAGGAADAPPCVSAGGRRYYESTHPTVLDALPEGFSQSGTTDAGGAADCPYYLNPDAPYLLYVRQPVRQDGAADGGTRTAFVRYVDERLRGRDLLSIDGALERGLLRGRAGRGAGALRRRDGPLRRAPCGRGPGGVRLRGHGGFFRV